MKSFLSIVAMALLMGCAGLMPVNNASPDKCLQDIAFKPLGIDVRGNLLHSPQEIQSRFGHPDSVQKQDIATSAGILGQTTVYSYNGKTFTFMTMQGLSCLYSLEITKGRIGCLKIGMSKSSFEQKFGLTDIEGEDGVESRNYIDENSGVRFNLILEFKNSRLIKVTPDWDEIFGMGS